MRGVGSAEIGSGTIGTSTGYAPAVLAAAAAFTFAAAAWALPGGVHATPTPGGDGFWGWVAAAAAAVGIKDIYEQGGQLELQKKLLGDRLGTNIKPGDLDSATSAAISMATGGANSIIGTTPAENLKGITELLSVTPDLKAAISLYPQMMRAAKDLEEVSGGKDKADDNMKTIAKALENLGGGIDPKTHELDPERMKVATNEAIKTIIAGGGFIDGATLFGMAKQAGGMGRISDPANLFDETLTALIDMGGNRTGTALAALGRQFLGDKMTVQTASELENIGILPHGSWRKGGGTGIIMNPGFDMKGVEDIKSGNLQKFFLETLGPAIRAKVGDNNADVMQESYKIFGQATGQRLGLMFLQNEAQRQRDVNLRHGVDPDAVNKGIYDKDLGMNLDNLGASIKGFAQVVGSAEIPAAITVIHGLTAAFRTLTQWEAQFPALMARLADNPVARFNQEMGAKFVGDGAFKGGSPHSIVGRDPRSPSTGPYAYTPPAPVVNVQPPVVTVSPNVNVQFYVDGELMATRSASDSRVVNSTFDHDGREGFASLRRSKLRLARRPRRAYLQAIGVQHVCALGFSYPAVRLVEYPPWPAPETVHRGRA